MPQYCFYSFRCKNDVTIDIPDVETYVVVQQPDAPTIVMSGTPNMAHGYLQIQNGINVFGDVSISVTHGDHNADGKSRRQFKYFNL